MENQPVTIRVHQSEASVVTSWVRRCILNAAGWTRDPAAFTGLQLHGSSVTAPLLPLGRHHALAAKNVSSISA